MWRVSHSAMPSRIIARQGPTGDPLCVAEILLLNTGGPLRGERVQELSFAQLYFLHRKNLPPGTQACSFWKKITICWSKSRFRALIFFTFFVFKGLFFNSEFRESNKRIFLVECQVTYIPNFTTNPQYTRNGELGVRARGFLPPLGMTISKTWGKKSTSFRRRHQLGPELSALLKVVSATIR